MQDVVLCFFCATLLLCHMGTLLVQTYQPVSDESKLGNKYELQEEAKVPKGWSVQCGNKAKFEPRTCSIPSQDPIQDTARGCRAEGGRNAVRGFCLKLC